MDGVSGAEPDAMAGDSLVFDPAAPGGGDAFGRYADLYATGADVQAVGERFFAALGARRLPGAAVFDRRLRDVAHTRDRRRIVRDGMEHFTLQLVRAGELRVDADGMRMVLSPGGGVLVDTTRPMRTETDGRIFTVSLPRARLRAAGLEPAHLHGLRLSPGAAAIQRLASPLAFEAEAALGVVLEGARALTGGAATRDPALRQERARSFIETHLGDPDLSPARIAAAVGLSRATLYRVFEPLGGVSEWVQARRLQHLRTLLGHTSLSVAEAGRLAGFGNPSHLTSAFQARFGVSPTAFRRTRPGPLPAGGAGAAAARLLADMGGSLASMDHDEPLLAA